MRGRAPHGSAGVRFLEKGKAMTNRTLWLRAAALVGFAATTASGQIANSRHNFASYSWSGGEICKPCHTPHFANVEVGFLWNHALTTATYVMFEGEEGTAVADIDSRSRMCMSCHDRHRRIGWLRWHDRRRFHRALGLIGTDLQNDHPSAAMRSTPQRASTSYNPPGREPPRKLERPLPASAPVGR